MIWVFAMQRVATRRPVPRFRFRLLDVHGNDVGHLEAEHDGWQPGDRLARWPGDRLEVVRISYTENGHEPIRGFLVVQVY